MSITKQPGGTMNGTNGSETKRAQFTPGPWKHSGTRVDSALTGASAMKIFAAIANARLIAQAPQVDGDEVTIIEPSDYRFMHGSEQRALFDAACAEAERQERAATDSRALCASFLNASRDAAEAERLALLDLAAGES